MDYKDIHEQAIAMARLLVSEGKLSQEIAEKMFPELKESEDERMRKELIEYFKHYSGGDNISIRFPKWIAWLEKQKEPAPIPDKFNGLKSLMLQYLQSATNRKDDSEIESDTDLWGRKILDYVWKYDGKQKEQKPLSTEETELNSIAFLEQLGYTCIPPESEKKPVVHENDTVSNPKTSIEILKHYLVWAENSEEDCPYTWKELAAAIKDGIIALEQKPAEWSEEDEKMLEEIINHIYTTSVQRIPARPGSDIGKNWIKFLKSLRPQPHWKPSKKQMDRLFSIVAALRKDYCDDMADFLASLYNDLKKL